MSLEEVDGMLEGAPNDPSTFSEEILDGSEDGTHPGEMPRSEHGIAANEKPDLADEIGDFMEKFVRAWARETTTPAVNPYAHMELMPYIPTGPIDPYASIRPPSYIPPRPASDGSAELKERSEDLQESIGLDARVDNYRVTELDEGVVGSRSTLVRNPWYSENVVSVDIDFYRRAMENGNERALYETLGHELIHSYTRQYQRPTGDLLEEESSISFNDKAVKREMNKMDEWYDVTHDESYSEEVRRIARREMEKRTQWLTEAVLGERSPGLAYSEATKEFDNYMRAEHGADMTDVDGIYDDCIPSSENPTPPTPMGPESPGIDAGYNKPVA